MCAYSSDIFWNPLRSLFQIWVQYPFYGLTISPFPAFSLSGEDLASLAPWCSNHSWWSGPKLLLFLMVPFSRADRVGPDPSWAFLCIEVYLVQGQNSNPWPLVQVWSRLMSNPRLDTGCHSPHACRHNLPLDSILVVLVPASNLEISSLGFTTYVCIFYLL